MRCKHLWIALLFIFARQGWSWEWPNSENDKVMPCRPTVACQADFVPAGTAELEAGILQKDLAMGSGQTSNPWLLKVSTEDWLQLQVGSNGFTKDYGQPDGSFFDNINLGAKFHLQKQLEWRPAVSLSLGFSEPISANQPAYVRSTNALAVAYFSKDFGRLHADFNVGLSQLRLGANPVDQEFLALALSTNLSSEWAIALENYYFSQADPLAANDAGLLAALFYTPEPWLTIDLGVDRGYVQQVRNESLFAGLTVIPQVLWRAKR